MTSNERQKKIIRLLDKRRKDTMEHLSIEFHVSTDTISRDIATLNEDYPIKIVRGRNGGLSRRIPLVQENVHDSCSGTRIT